MLAFFQGRNETPRLGTLRQLALFSTLSRLELRVVDGLLHERRFLKGEIIFDEGEEGQALHVVIAGRVLICRQGEPEAGRITEIDAGVAFGELALLENSPRALQARAEADCVVGGGGGGGGGRQGREPPRGGGREQLGRQLRDRSPLTERRPL